MAIKFNYSVMHAHNLIRQLGLFDFFLVGEGVKNTTSGISTRIEEGRDLTNNLGFFRFNG